MFSSMKCIMSAISRMFSFLLNRRKPAPPQAYYKAPSGTEYVAPTGAKFVKG